VVLLIGLLLTLGQSGGVIMVISKLKEVLIAAVLKTVAWLVSLLVMKKNDYE